MNQGLALIPRLAMVGLSGVVERLSKSS